MRLLQKHSLTELQRTFGLFLLPLSALYRIINSFRNMLYDLNLKTVRTLPKPVISIGNISAGGTGKTPFLLALLKLIEDMDVNTAVLTRGYGRLQKIPVILRVDPVTGKADKDIDKTGDEPLMIALKHPGIAVGIDADRYQSGNRILKNHPDIDLFLLDDGFQHRQLHRDLDLVIIDVTRPFIEEKVIPAGLLREPLSNLKRADCFVLSRFSIAPENGRRIKKFLIERFPQTYLVIVEQKMGPIIHIETKEIMKNENLRNSRLGAFSGIGNPASFQGMLKDLPSSLVFHEAFPDHHHYTASDLERLYAKTRKNQCQALITTEKDMVKLAMLPDSFDKSIPLYVLSMTMEINEEKKFRQWLAEKTRTLNIAGKQI